MASKKEILSLQKNSCMLIYLIGYMGCGKSKIAKQLSNYFGIEYIDTDSYIEEKQRTSISEIWNTQGEIGFRELEKQTLETLITTVQKPTIIACGGGLPCYGQNMQLLLHTGISFYIKQNTGIIINRLSQPAQQLKRPLIKNLTTTQLEKYVTLQILQREAFYTQANYTIDTQHLQKMKTQLSIILSL